ncbi:hypothetical protein DFAR_790003 [Desulfarculales bacterium]
MVRRPRVERISQNVWAVIGYDIASTVIITTPEGLVVVNAGMTLAHASQAMFTLEEQVPWGPVKALIFTHSHIRPHRRGNGMGNRGHLHLGHRAGQRPPAQAVQQVPLR